MFAICGTLLHRLKSQKMGVTPEKLSRTDSSLPSVQRMSLLSTMQSIFPDYFINMLLLLLLLLLLFHLHVVAALWPSVLIK